DISLSRAVDAARAFVSLRGRSVCWRCFWNASCTRLPGTASRRADRGEHATTKEGLMVYRTCVAAATLLAAGLATAAPPKVVTAANSDPQCFVPWASTTKLFQYPAKKGPYRIALANGFIANTWRIQMIKTAKAYAAQPEVAAKLREFKVVSTGEDVAAQIAAINNFIDSGYDAIIVNAQNPAAFKPVIKRANDAGVVLVAFDNTLDTDEAINVDVDQKGLGKYWAEWLVKNVPNGGK